MIKASELLAKAVLNIAERTNYEQQETEVESYSDYQDEDYEQQSDEDFDEDMNEDNN